MGLFSNIFHRRNSDPNALLKEATALKKEGNLDAAITKLRQAYDAISTTNVTYDVKPFLRLPMYLQEAGRNDEAWKELNNLLLGFPNQLKSEEVLPMTHSIIYDKMRLFLQREKKFEKAVLFSVFSYLCWIKGLSLQRRKHELRDCLRRKTIEQAIASDIRKAKLTRLAEQLVDIVERQAERLPDLDLHRVEEEFRKISKNAKSASQQC